MDGYDEDNFRRTNMDFSRTMWLVGSNLCRDLEWWQFAQFFINFVWLGQHFFALVLEASRSNMTRPAVRC